MHLPEDFPELSGISRRSFLKGIAAIACLRMPLRAEAAAGQFDPFAFGYISDVHLATQIADTYRLTHESQLFLQDAVKHLNSEKLDFVVFGGDQVETLGKDQSNWQLFQDVAQSLNAPWSFVLGEQDVTDVFPVDKLRTYGPDWKSKGIETERSYWSQSPLAGVHIIGLDTSRPNSPTGDFSGRQLDWLKKDLAANRRKFTIVFSHHPLLPPPPYDGGPPWDEYIVPQGPAVREVLASSPYVRLAISGHVHASKVQQEQNIWYVSCSSLDVYPCNYRIFRVTSDSITMETYQVQFPALVKKARKMLVSSTLAYKYSSTKPDSFVELLEGARVDNDALLPLGGGQSAKPLTKKKPRKETAAQEEKKAKKEKPKKAKQEKGKPGKEKPPAKEQQTAPEEQPATKEEVPPSTDEQLHGKEKQPPASDSTPPAKADTAPEAAAPAGDEAETSAGSKAPSTSVPPKPAKPSGKGKSSTLKE